MGVVKSVAAGGCHANVLWVRVRRLQKVGPHVAHGCKAHIPAANCRPFLLVVIAGAGCRGTVEGSVAGGWPSFVAQLEMLGSPREMSCKVRLLPAEEEGTAFAYISPEDPN